MNMSAWLTIALSLFALFVFAVTFLLFGRRLARIPRSWEPTSKSVFRQKVGFIYCAGNAVGVVLANEQREHLWARIKATTEKQSPDQRIKLWPHGDALEFRCRWTGRGWEPAPPMFDRAEVWTEGVLPDSDVAQNRLAAGMKDCEDDLHTGCETD